MFVYIKTAAAKGIRVKNVENRQCTMTTTMTTCQILTYLLKIVLQRGSSNVSSQWLAVACCCCGSVSNIINWLATHDAVANYTHTHTTQTTTHPHTLAHISFVLLASTFLYLFQVAWKGFSLGFFSLSLHFYCPGMGPILQPHWHFICCAQVDPLSFVCAPHRTVKKKARIDGQSRESANELPAFFASLLFFFCIFFLFFCHPAYCSLQSSCL